MGGRGHRLRWMAVRIVGAAMTVAGLFYAARQLASREHLSAADTATLVTLPIGVAALLVSVLALRRAPEGGLADLSRGWAATLAAQVKESETQQWRALLGDDAQRINLTFALRPAPSRSATVPADTGRMFAGTSTVPDVADYYRQTQPRRLVITGAPGAGKTVLALELMLALLEDRSEEEPVPLRMSLAEWDTRTPLRDLLVQQLIDVYDWPADMAAQLVRHQRVIPVLDGLDEMDPTRPDGTPSPVPPRALAALHALNAYQEGRNAGPLVLTCRTGHYDALATRTRLLDAARIDINTVPARDAGNYLRQRADDPARWQPVLDMLQNQPAGPLASTLSTPWRLCLAATVYAREGDPAELTRHTTSDGLREHLLGHFIPATTALSATHGYDAATTHRWLARLAASLQAPRAQGGPGEAEGAQPGTDLILHQLWQLLGRRRVRAVDALLTALVLLVLPLFVLSALHSIWPYSDDQSSYEFLLGAGRTSPFFLLPGRFEATVGVGALAVFAGLAAFAARPRTPQRIEWRLLRTRDGLRRFARGLRRRILTGLKWGLVAGIALDAVALYWDALSSEQSVCLGVCLVVPDLVGIPLFTVVLGFYSGLVGGILGGLVDGASGEPVTTATPRSVIRGTVPHGVMAGLASGFTGGLIGFFLENFDMSVEVTDGGSTSSGTLVRLGHVILLFVTGRWTVVREFLADGFPGAGEHAGIGMLHFAFELQAYACVTLGLAAALAACLITTGLGRRYAVFLLCTRGQLPLRLGAFLDSCCAAGMMRQSGTAYQFRHRELQQWLAAHPEPPPPDGRRLADL